jgi:hypothetical protein
MINSLKDAAIEKLKIDDDQFIPNTGDVRYVKQQGKIDFKNGRSENVMITFERKRNIIGGVDVIAHVSKPLGMQSKKK